MASPGAVDGDDQRCARPGLHHRAGLLAQALPEPGDGVVEAVVVELVVADADAVRQIEPAVGDGELRRLRHERIHKLRLRRGRRLRQRCPGQHCSGHHDPPCSARPSIAIHRTPQCIQRTAYAIGDLRARAVGDAKRFPGQSDTLALHYDRSQTSCETASQA